MSWDNISEIIFPLIIFGVYIAVGFFKKKTDDIDTELPPSTTTEEGSRRRIEAAKAHEARRAEAARKGSDETETPDFQSARRLVEEMTRRAGGEFYGGTSYAGENDEYEEAPYENKSDIGEGRSYSASAKGDTRMKKTAAREAKKERDYIKGAGYLSASEMQGGVAASTREYDAAANAPYYEAAAKLENLLKQAKVAAKNVDGLGENDAYALKTPDGFQHKSFADAYKISTPSELAVFMRHDKAQARRAIIYAEIIGKPVSMRDPFERL